MRRFLVITAAAFLVHCFAQETKPAKQMPPPPGSPRPFHFPKYETKKLANGLTVFVIEDHREPLVSYELNIVTAGASANQASQAGLASLTASLLREGTKTRSAQDVAKLIDSSGGNLGTGAGTDTASAECTMMKSKADLGLDLLADIIINPSFPQEEVERQMRQTLSGLQVSFSDPSSLAGYLSRRVVFGTHPYAMPVSGTPDTLRKIKREDIVNFYETHYGPAYTYLAISGDVTPADAFAKADKYFGKWQSNSPAPAILPPAVSTARRIVVVDKPDAVQTQYSIVQVAIPRNDPDYIPLQIANQIFGGSFNSRLNMKLRANEGLTYGASSALEGQRQSGVFIARSFSRTDKTATAIKMMADLLKEYRESPVTEGELKEAKAYLAGSFALGLETPGAVAQAVLRTAIYGLPPNYYETYRDKVLAITAEQVTAAVRRHFVPDKMDIVAAGNASGFVKDLAALGKVDVVPLAEFDLTAANLRRAAEPTVAATGETKARGIKMAQDAADAVGGKAALDAVKSIESKGPMAISMGAQSIKGDVDEVVVYPDKYRASLTLPMGTMVQAFDGKVAWMQQGPQTREAPPEMAKEVQRDIMTAGLVGLLRSAIEGQAEVVATGDHSLIWTMGDQKVNVSVDAGSKRVAKLSYHGMGLQGPADLDIEFADYRKAGDLYLPFKETMYQNGQKFADREYTERKVNVDVKPEVFAKPEK